MHDIRVRLGLFCVAAATLMLELLLTRVFDVILTPNLAYMVIACTLFSFGLAGVYVALRPPAAPERGLPLLSLLLAAAALLLRPGLNVLPFDYDAITERPIEQAAAFAGMYLALVVPFFLAGLVFTLLFSSRARSIQALYFWDLTGAAVGCVLIIPLLEPIGPGGAMFVAAAFAIAASGLFAPGRAWLPVGVAAALGLAAIPFVRAPGYFEFTEHVSKRGVREARLAGTIEVSRWDPVSKIDVIAQGGSERRTGGLEPSDARKHLAYDGGTQSSHIYPFDGNLAALRARLESGTTPIPAHFWHRGVLASHYVTRDSGQNVLVLGSAGGQETKAALMFGAARLDAVEMVQAVIELVTDRYADYGGRLFLDPRVRVHATEGRTFLRSPQADTYDIIQIHSNHTSSSVAAGTGAMSPNYLQTADAYRDYFAHLRPDGILHINHFGFPRMITTAALAWRQIGRTEFQRHVVVFGLRDARDTLPTLLIRMRPWTAAEVDDLRSFFASSGPTELPFDLLQNPLDPAGSFLPTSVFSGEAAPDFLSRADVQLRPSTDNRPFFNFLRRRSGPITASRESFTDPATAHLLNSQLRKDVIPMDLIHLIVTGVVSLCFAAACIVVPLVRSNIRHVGVTAKYASMVYFSCLGAGFILFELVFIQIFMKLIGYPVHTYALVIFTLLLGAGLGSASSERLGISEQARWSWPFVAIVLYGILFAAAYESVFGRFLASGDLMRMSIAGLLIFPLGFFLGMPFPLGILLVERQPAGAIAWAWGLNSLFTVIGSLASVLLAIGIGFQATILVAVALYIGAFAAFATLRVAMAAERFQHPHTAIRLQFAGEGS